MSAPQKMAALKKAETTRVARSMRKQWLRADGDRRESLRRAVAMLDDIPPEMRTCDVATFLLSLYRVGRETMAEICRKVSISEWRRLESLTVRNRRMLAQELGRRGAS